MIHKIGWKNLPLNESTRVCSEHVVNSTGRMLRSDEVPTVKLPTLPTQVTPTTSRRQLVRCTLPECTSKSNPECSKILYADAAVNTDMTLADIEALEKGVSELKDQLHQSEQACADISNDNDKIRFYTGFSTLAALMACFKKPDGWPKWHRRFEQFLNASGLEKESDTRRISTLLYCRQGRRRCYERIRGQEEVRQGRVGVRNASQDTTKRHI